ncbi:MAG TPA: VOC family protein, partial [Tissierellaceae bacterium]|nr:VOC family protein [Tissierellaceae bacterium]
MIKTKGIHHITSLVGNVEENVDFYGRILGLRLVKKTVNFDDPRTYHLYFGDRKGNPGTVITFFPYEDTRAGIVGDGQVGITSYMIPNGASNFWKERLEKYNINYQLTSRLGEDFISFKDHHGLKIELVERDEANENQWSISGIGPDVAIKGFAGAVLYSIKPYETAATLETLFG